MNKIFFLLTAATLNSCSPKVTKPSDPNGSVKPTHEKMLWTELDSAKSLKQLSEAGLRLKHYKLFSLDSFMMREILSHAVREKTWLNGQRNLEIDFPKPDSGNARFTIYESTVMDSALAAAYPAIKTYAGKSVNDPSGSVRFEFNTNGFHAYIKSSEGEWFIQPLLKNISHQYLLVFFKKDLPEGSKLPFEIPDSSGGK